MCKDPSQIQTFVKCLESHCPGRGHSQHRWCPDALLFLRDFFTTLAASINPVVPAENSAEGEQLGR